MMKKMGVLFVMVFALIGFYNVNPENAIGSEEITNIKNVPFWDGETDVSPDGDLINRYGGPIIENGTNITRTTNIAHSGQGSYHVYLKPTSDFDFFQLALSGFGSTDEYIMTRDINIFQGLSFWMQNDTGAEFVLKLEIKDNNKNSLYELLDISKESNWVKYDINFSEMTPIDNRTIDLTQAQFIGFVFQASAGVSLSGDVYIDDTVMVEKGDTIYAETADLKIIVEQIARRQFLSLWGARNRTNGLLPLNTTFADVAALNVTACLVKLLPSGVKQCFITQKEADDYIEILLKTLNLLMDKAKYLPPRYIDWVSLKPKPTISQEESPIDAAFIALALYQYKELPTTSAELKASINKILSRFDFKAFGSSSPAGWKLAYKYTKELPNGTYDGSFTVGTYDGYSTEIYLISLIAAILDQVDITQYWNTGIKRKKDYLASCELSHVVHSDSEYRAPFLQWLFPLFVNLNSFGADTYPDVNLRVNPLQNAINYQKDIDLELKTRGRELFLQPDAGDDGSGKNYKQFSCYLNDESKNYLFMPWSVALSLLVDDGIAEPALRNHLKNNLHSPFGLSDSAYQMTGIATPEKITARHDLWNTGLSTIAMFSYLFSDNVFLTNIPKVKCVLKEVLNSYSSCNSYKIFTNNESCEFIIKCGDYVKVFGAGSNTITVQSGGKVECVNFIGTNVINIKDSASGFTVRRSGATVYLENLSTGTFIKIPATKTTAQTIIFNNITLTLVIKTNQVMLGNQVINLTQSPIL